MRLIATGLSAAAVASGLRIEIDSKEQARWESNLPSDIPKPVLVSFKNHLHSLSGLFSSIVTGSRITPAQAEAAGADNGLSIEREDSCDAPQDGTDFPNWAGSYCLISYDDKSCANEFNCHFSETTSQLPSGSKLCCRSGEFSESFGTGKTSGRVFFSSADDAANASCPSAQAGHFGLHECIFVTNPKPEEALYLNKFDLGQACKIWGPEHGYYSINPIPDTDGYAKSEQNWVGNTEMEICARHITYTSTEDAALAEVHNIMPFCTFKLEGEACPSYAPSFLSFPSGNGPHLPNDNLYTVNTWLDTAGFCCSLTDHLTVEKTIVNLDHLNHDFTMNDFQVIKWPYAPCPEFEFPAMDLTVYNMAYSGATHYPFENADMNLTICNYKQPSPENAEAVEAAPAQAEAPAAKEDTPPMIFNFGASSDSNMKVVKSDDLYKQYDAEA